MTPCHWEKTISLSYDIIKDGFLRKKKKDKISQSILDELEILSINKVGFKGGGAEVLC